ncbi:alpha/beta hydrolase [Streptomyces mirabilis]|uniref:alpha/beta hydrolase n=1 Tax=Streptomyces mirabilis TaxID=68239 RepID=UPI003647C9EE
MVSPVVERAGSTASAPRRYGARGERRTVLRSLRVQRGAWPGREGGSPRCRSRGPRVRPAALDSGRRIDRRQEWPSCRTRPCHPTLAPANPLRSLPTDAAYLASVLASISGPIVLVGHSYGGAVITNAAAGIPNVKALVYIAAFVPDKGEQLGVLINKYPGSIIQPATRPVPYPGPDGTTGTDLYLEAGSFRAVFAADLPAATTRLMHATQRPFSAACFTDVTTSAAWHTIPSWALMSEADKAIPPALQRFFYQRAGAPQGRQRARCLPRRDDEPPGHHRPPHRRRRQLPQLTPAHRPRPALRRAGPQARCHPAARLRPAP